MKMAQNIFRVPVWGSEKNQELNHSNLEKTLLRDILPVNQKSLGPN
jgi:hypothetical protein